MSLSRQDFINYLINEGKRSLVSSDPSFYKTLYIFINSPEGQLGLSKFKKLDPTRIGLHEPKSASHIVKRMFK